VRKAGFFGACRLGWSKSLLTAVTVYQSLRRILFTHTVSSSQLGGPLFIGYVTYKTATAGLSRLLYFLGIIGINLSLVNLLPIPILDGGHLLVIAVEKIKGSPVSPRALALAQYVGLALLVSLFLFLTYNDITVHLKLLLGG
jgi:regulator of sigma E protease